jgi:hypothetical protein
MFETERGFPMSVALRAAWTKNCCMAIIAVAMLTGAGVLMAHHSFAMFDTTTSVTLTGTVTEFQWTNPHAYIELDVPDGSGAAKPAKHWSIELGSPSILQQSGWKFKDLKFGDKVTVTINPLRNQSPGGLLVQVTLPDGRVLGNGPGRGPAGPAPAPAR